MTTPAEYRTYSDECLQASRVAQVPEVRAALVKMAQRWRAMAERAEHQHSTGQTSEARRSPESR